MAPGDPLDELVEGMLRDPDRPEALWEEALDGLRERLRAQGLLRRTRSAAADASGSAPADAFGLDPARVEQVRPYAEWLYEHWFRVRSQGHEHLPAQGAAVLVANHGGLLPFDGAMLIVDGLRHSGRLMRALVDRWVRDLPGIRGGFEALGQVVGTRENFRGLLAAGECVLVFPEGMLGIRKNFLSRFHLEPFHPGFVEEALRAEVPIVPVALIGPESQAPLLAELPALARRMHLPTFPITPTFPWLGPLGLIPLPVRYRIAYGPPIEPDTLRYAEPREVAQDLRERLQGMVDALRSAATHETGPV